MTNVIFTIAYNKSYFCKQHSYRSLSSSAIWHHVNVPIVSDISKDSSATIIMVKQSKKIYFYTYHAYDSVPVSS